MDNRSDRQAEKRGAVDLSICDLEMRSREVVRQRLEAAKRYRRVKATMPVRSRLFQGALTRLPFALTLAFLR